MGHRAIMIRISHSELGTNIQPWMTRWALNQCSFFWRQKQEKQHKKEANGPRLAHLSEIATAYMQTLCNIFPVLSLQLMKGSSFWAIVGFNEEKCVYYYIFTMGSGISGEWPFEQTLNSVSTIGLRWNLVKTGQVVSEELYNNMMILYMSTAQG